MFLRLVSLSYTSHASDATPEFSGVSAAVLFLLREAMHHLGFSELVMHR